MKRSALAVRPGIVSAVGPGLATVGGEPLAQVSGWDPPAAAACFHPFGCGEDGSTAFLGPAGPDAGVFGRWPRPAGEAGWPGERGPRRAEWRRRP